MDRRTVGLHQAHKVHRFVPLTQSVPTHSPDFVSSHNPADTTSTRILATLNDAILEYPPLRKSTPRYPPRQLRAPLKLTLNVIARAPTAAEFCAILAHSPGFSIASFVRTTQTKDWPTNVDALVALVEKDPTLLAWPVIVDWKYGESSIGGKGCIKLLDAALHRRNKALKPRDKRLKKQRSMY
ncbi:hypothetical protein DFH09DRAFT_1128209 [Mycena vulgaris]|nr:hypothetical protein DFH09DRAFT_1128209 [Mycena vulgaris]